MHLLTALLYPKARASTKLAKEAFALYGFEAEIPSDWRVELNPKSNRHKGDVVFHSAKGNRFFVSWGELEDAKKKFKTLEEQRDKSINQLKKGPDVKLVMVSDSREDQIGGHRALFSHVAASVKQGMMSKRISERDMWSAHFYCPEISRYYVIYSLLRDSQEYPEFGPVFDSFAKSFSCHARLRLLEGVS